MCNCYYEILGIKKPTRSGEVSESVKSHFKTISRFTHPDVVNNFLDIEVRQKVQMLITHAKTTLLDRGEEREYHRDGDVSRHICMEYIGLKKLILAILFLSANKPEKEDKLSVELRERILELKSERDELVEYRDVELRKARENLSKLEEREASILDSIKQLEVRLEELNREIALEEPSGRIEIKRGRPKKSRNEEGPDQTIGADKKKTRTNTIDPGDPNAPIKCIERVIGMHLNKNGMKIGIELPSTRTIVYVEDFKFLQIHNSRAKLKEYFESLNKPERDEMFRKQRIRKMYLNSISSD